MKRASRIISFLLALVMLWALVPLGTVEAEAAGLKYDRDAAVAYAAAHWDDENVDGSETHTMQCAAFVSKCLRVGGLKGVYANKTGSLYRFLTGTNKEGEIESKVYGTAHVLVMRDDKCCYAVDNPEIEIGDPVFIWCTDHKVNAHVEIYSGTDSMGRMLSYAHNYAKNNKTLSSGFKSREHNSSCIWELHAVHIELCDHNTNRSAHAFHLAGICNDCGGQYDYSKGAVTVNGILKADADKKFLTLREGPYADSPAIRQVYSAVYVDKIVTNCYNNNWYHVCSMEAANDCPVLDAYVYCTDKMHLSLADATSTTLDISGLNNMKGVKLSKATLTSAGIIQEVEITILDKTANAIVGVFKDAVGLRSYSLEEFYKLKIASLKPGRYETTIYAKTLNSANVITTSANTVAFVVDQPALPVYTVTLSPNGGNGSAQTRTATSGSALSGVVTPTRYNYNFLGWSTFADATSPFYAAGSPIIPYGSMNLYAVWEALQPPDATYFTNGLQQDVGEGRAATVTWQSKERASAYTVTFYKPDGSEYFTATTAQTAASTIFQTAGRYTAKVKALNTAGESAWSDAAVITVHEPSLVTFMDYNDTVWSTQSVAYGDAAVKPTENPVREGYRFSGWEGSLENVKAARTLTAKYTAIPYTVKFMKYGSNEPAKTQTVYYNGDTPGAATPPADSELNIPAGWTRLGWDTNEYTAVKRDGIVVTPCLAWGKQDLPVTAAINSVTPSGSGYWVGYTVTNHVNSARLGRVVIILRTNSNKFLAKTESGAFYLEANPTETPADDVTLNSSMYVPVVGDIQNEALAYVDLMVVDSYDSMVPIATAVQPYRMVSEDGDWSMWMTTEEFATYTGDKSETQTKTEYRSKAKIITDWLTSSPGASYSVYASRTLKSDWSAVMGPVDYNPGTNDNQIVAYRPVEIAAAYDMYRYGRYTDNAGHIHFNNYSGANLYGGTWVASYSEWSTTYYAPTSEYNCVATTNNALGNGVYMLKNGNYRYRWNTYKLGTRTYYWQETMHVNAVMKDQWIYQTRYDIPQSRYYRWPGDEGWTAWTTTPATATNDLQVETRTLTRVKMPEPQTEGIYTVTGRVEGIADVAGREAVLSVYKVDAASDYTNEYVGQTVLGANGEYAFSFFTLETPSARTGDFTATLTIEGCTSPLFINTGNMFKAPKEQYLVTFVDEVTGQQIGATQTVEEGAAVTAPEVPAKEGYTFLGWEYGLTNIRDNMIINARFVKNKYTVVYVDWANSTISMQTDVPYGTALTMPELESRPGYTFTGWQAEDGCDMNRVTRSMIVTAQYEQIQYTVRFLDTDGSVLSEQTVGYGEAAVLPDLEEVTVESGQYAQAWNADGCDCVTQPLSILPAVLYEDDAAYPEVSLEGEVYEGAQTLAITSEDEDAAITYTVLGGDGDGDTDIPYTAPITLTQSAVLSITCSVPGKNSASATYEYVIVPNDQRPAAPTALTATADTEKVTLSWDAVQGADGYVVRKTNAFGSEERFFATGTTYADENVEAIYGYTYTVSSYCMYESNNGQTYLESTETSPETSVTFFGEHLPVQAIAIHGLSSSMVRGDTTQLLATVEPSTAYDQTVTWKVTPGTGSATITAGGMLTATRAGTVTVTATANDGSGTEGTAELTVTEPVSSALTMRVGSGAVQTGTTSTVSVSIGENSQAAILQFALLYDSSVLNLDSAVAGAAMSGKEPTINSATPGVVYFNWDSTVGLTDGGSLIDLTFSAKSGAADCDVLLNIPKAGADDDYEFICMKLVEGEPQDIRCEVYNGKISVTSVLRGDVNEDGRINVIDANMVRRYAAQLISLSAGQKLAGDVNGDGKVNVIDANYIRRFAAHIIDAFPAA